MRECNVCSRIYPKKSFRYLLTHVILYSRSIHKLIKNVFDLTVFKFNLDKVCEAEFDGFMCWPAGLPGSIVESACPAGFGEGGGDIFNYF